jgi:MoaA/NifB/PqqE/SkfB family radical SAM enzyme
MLQYNKIKKIHLELTSKCNASCPQCSRNLSGGKTNPLLPLSELSLEDIKTLFPSKFVKDLKELFMCGNYGDAIVAKDTLEIFKYFRELNNEMRLLLHTNGSARDKGWWEDLAKTRCIVRFGIDGLENTNHIYRRGTNWKKIMENSMSFISAGGRAEWCYIVFKHNEHEVKLAEKISKEIGFEKFIIKRTKRFHHQNKGYKIEKTPVFGIDGHLEYYIEPPTDPLYQIEITAPWKYNDESKYEQYLLTTDIKCLAVYEQMIYISAQGFVLPCCWLGDIYPKNKTFKSKQIWRLIEQMPQKEDSINGLINNVENIVNGPFFQKLIPKCWLPENNKNNRLMICATTCGIGNIVENQIGKQPNRD